jgi:hypothetical protein
MNRQQKSKSYTQKMKAREKTGEDARLWVLGKIVWRPSQTQAKVINPNSEALRSGFPGLM